MQSYQFSCGDRARYIAFIVGFCSVAAWVIYPFFFGKNIVYGSMSSWQFFPLTLDAHEKLTAGSYGLFSFDFGFGFDSLADSQQSLLHPVKLVLMALLQNAALIDTYFLVFHYCLMCLALWVLSASYSESRGDASVDLVGRFLCVVSFCFGIAVYANFVHPFFIAALAYGFLLVAWFIRFIEKPTAMLATGVVVSCWLMLLCGNFAMQWLLVLFLVALSVFTWIVARTPITTLVFAWILLGLGFILAAPQLLPTLDLMGLSDRAVAGGADKFVQSPGPIQWFGYFSPGVSYLLWKFTPEVYRGLGENNIVEGIHYVGLLPLAAVLSMFRSDRRLSSTQVVLSACLVFFVLRSLGVFSPINILLNHLPFFGQFRIPVRSLFLVDVIVCLLAATSLRKSVEDQSLLLSIKFISLVVAGWFLFGVSILFARTLVLEVDLPDVSKTEWAYALFSLMIALTAIFILQRERFSIKIKLLLVGLLAVADMAGHLQGVPIHWRIESTELISKRGSSIDRICSELGTASFFTLNRTWPEFDMPLFPVGNGSGAHYATRDGTTPEANGLRCTVTYSVFTSTLTPSAIRGAIGWVAEQGVFEKQLEALSLLGVSHVAGFTGLTGRGEVPQELVFRPTPPPATDIRASFARFSEDQLSNAAATRLQVLRFWYAQLDRFNLVGKLPTTTRPVVKRMDGTGVIFLPPPFSYVITIDGAPAEVLAVGGGVVRFDASNAGDLVSVVFVPAAFLTGVVLAFLGVIAVVLLLVTRRFWKPIVATEVGRSLSRRNPHRLLDTSLFRRHIDIARTGLLVIGAVLTYRILEVAGFSSLAIINVALILFLSFAVFGLFRFCIDKEAAAMIALILFCSYCVGVNYLSIVR
jgi:hypothetical protein